MRHDELAETITLGQRSLIAFVGGAGRIPAADAFARALGTEVEVDPDRADDLFTTRPHVVVVIGGDRDRPFTVAGPLEPVFPVQTTHVIACIGADAIGRCIGDQCAHPLRIAALAGCGPFERLTPERAARVLMSPSGSQKNHPPKARFAIAVTGVDDRHHDAVAHLTAEIGSAAPVLGVRPSRQTPASALDASNAGVRPSRQTPGSDPLVKRRGQRLGRDPEVEAHR